MIAYALLTLVPVALGVDHFGAGPVWVFLTASAAVSVLANWVRRGIEQMAMHVGPSIGGLLKVSFGSVAELILAVFVLLSGQIQVVLAQITGAIMATSLLRLRLGLAALAGGIERDRQRFSCANAGLLSTLLVLLTIALVLPAVFETAERAGPSQLDVDVTSEELSLAISGVLVPLYAANLVYTLAIH